MAIFPKMFATQSPSSRWTDGTDGFWETPPRFLNQTIYHYDPVKGEKLYERQAGHLASALLVSDYDPQVEVDEYYITGKLKCVFPNKGELVSGSFMSRSLVKAQFNHTDFVAEDVDIYFKCKADALEFVKMNGLTGFSFTGPVCAYGYATNPNGHPFKLNLIYGVDYSSPGNLISRYDIRACSMALDPNNNKAYVVRGSLNDALSKDLVFNPVPRGVSIRRLVKYISKGFTIDKHQRLFFTELVRSDIYSTELELHTADY